MLRQAVLDLLTETLLSIRSGSTHAEVVRDLADHVHNLPTLLAQFHPDLLAYYWETERPCFLRYVAEWRTPDILFDPKIFQPMWSVMEQEYLRLCRGGRPS